MRRKDCGRFAEKDEHRPSEIEKKKAFHGVKTSNWKRLINRGIYG